MNRIIPYTTGPLSAYRGRQKDIPMHHPGPGLKPGRLESPERNPRRFIFLSHVKDEPRQTNH